MSKPRKTLRQERDLAFARGYQEALADLLTKLDEGGEAEARVWIKNNTVKL